MLNQSRSGTIKKRRIQLIIDSTGKIYEKPDSGLFVGVLADIVYITAQEYEERQKRKNKPMPFGAKAKARLVWILDAKDKAGNYYQVSSEVNQSLNEKATLFGLVKDIRNGVPPPVPFELDELIGSVNGLVITREKSPDGKNEFANVKAIIATPAGRTFAVPAGFKRAKDTPKSGMTAPATTTPATSNAPAQAATVDNTPVIQF